MKIIKSELLNLIDDNELLIVCKNSNLEIFIVPMKRNPSKYTKYIKTLGRLEKKSHLVQKLIPQYAVDFYLKGDEEYIKAFGSALSSLKKVFEDACDKIGQIDLSQLNDYKTEKLVELYKDVDNTLNMEVTSELYIVFLKLQGVVFNEDTRSNLEEKIKEEIAREKLKKDHRREIDDALKHQEKEINAQFNQERDRYHKEKKKLSKENADLKKEIESLYAQVSFYEEHEKAEYKKLIDKWNKLLEKDIEQKRKAQEQKLNQIYKDELAEIRRKISEERNKLENEKIDAIDKMRADKIAEEEILSSEILSLESKKEQLNRQISDLNNEIDSIQRNLEEHRAIENNFYENIEKRIYEKKIDEEFVSRLKFSTKQQHASEISQVTTKTHNDIWSNEKELLCENSEECAPVLSLLDFEADLSDNLAIYFEGSEDVSITAIAAMVCKKSMIVEQSVANRFAVCISTIVDACNPYCVYVHDTTSVYMGDLIKNINCQKNKIVLIDGVLDKYDEQLFSALNRNCEDKYLIFSVADLDNLKLCSKAIFNYAIIMDIEKYYTYESDEKILVAHNDICGYQTELDMSKCKVYYEKVFRGLVSKKIISKKNSIDFSKMLQIYFKLMGNEQICEVMKKSILFCCSYEEDQETEKALQRAGLK